MEMYSQEHRAAYVQKEFSLIASRYELMNQIMTFGQVNQWRLQAINKLDVRSGQIVLDLAAGGGQLTSLLQAKQPNCRVFPSDFNLPMMLVGRQTGLSFYAADALLLPHPNQSAERVICAFLLRNVVDYPLVLREVLRVLKPGGIFVSLDTTPPVAKFLQPFIRMYMRLAIPVIGAILTGRFTAYNYLIRSSEQFALAETLAGELTAAGFEKVGFKRIMLGSAAIHWGMKPEERENG
jgi:demethylmenaquinone methyltransferase / 2-methoxy-6-polyprenyl-1,4-benzoquinol methylase